MIKRLFLMFKEHRWREQIIRHKRGSSKGLEKAKDKLKEGVL